VDRLGHVKCVKFNTNFLTVYFRIFKRTAINGTRSCSGIWRTRAYDQTRVVVEIGLCTDALLLLFTFLNHVLLFTP